jgi:hypothetical protein
MPEAKPKPLSVSNAALSAQLENLAANLPADARQTLREAARRIRDELGNPYPVVALRVLSKANPMMIEGTLADGDSFFVRYREGKLTVHVDDMLIEFIELPDMPPPGALGFDRIQSLLAHVLDFSGH